MLLVIFILVFCLTNVETTPIKRGTTQPEPPSFAGPSIVLPAAALNEALGKGAENRGTRTVRNAPADMQVYTYAKNYPSYIIVSEKGIYRGINS